MRICNSGVCTFATLLPALLGFLVGVTVFSSLEGLKSIAETRRLLSFIIDTSEEITPRNDQTAPLSNAITGFARENIHETKIRNGNEMKISQQSNSIIVDDVPRKKLEKEDARKKMIFSLWEHSPYLELSKASDGNESKRVNGAILNIFPRPPHLEDCKAKAAQYIKWDTRGQGGSLPHWSYWKGLLSRLELEHTNNTATIDHLLLPWVDGADADNLPMTRIVQRDLWLHQHPKNCSDPNLKFLYVDWDTRRSLGLGAMVTSMAGFLAVALRENRILVTNHFSRAAHAGCVGSCHAHWHCYFLPETSPQCRKRAVDLASQPGARKQSIVTHNKNYKIKDIWFGEVPGHWGSPWEYMQPTSEIDAKLLLHHLAKDRRWWRAQAVRYLMRFPTEYTCNLMNQARHQAFGTKAADMVLRYLPSGWPEVPQTIMKGEMEKFVWESHNPWVPRPLMSIHVRLGDKALEMKMVGFRGYMELAYRVRARFPEVENIWLSTEMQDVVDESKTYKGWNFYFTNVTRQIGAISMESYETNLGKESSTGNAIVNFLMAVDADFFIGALGSTWCSLIDGMRTTGGKEMAGYLSVNKDRFW